MVPRTKVNYRLRDLARAYVGSTTTVQPLSQLTHSLERLFEGYRVLLTASGRGALYLLLRALPQATVVVPSYTCKAVVEAAKLAGKNVVFVECEANDFNAKASSMAPLINAQSIVIATHQFGIPCDILAIAELCSRSGAFLVEDVAAALGSRVAGRPTGTFGDAAFFSFDSTKLINVPMKGGFLVVKDTSVFARVVAVHAATTQPMTRLHQCRTLVLGAALVLLQNHRLYDMFHTVYFKWRRRFTEDTPSLDVRLSTYYRYRMEPWQARVALEQMSRLDELVNARRRFYAEYRRRLQGCTSFALPPADRHAEWACIRFPIRVHREKLEFYRRAVTRGIDFAFSFTYLACPKNFRTAHEIAASVLDLPFYTKLSEREMAKVVSTLRQLDAEFAQS